MAPAAARSQAEPKDSKPPTYFQRLIEAGNVKFDFYARRPAGQRYPGRALFYLNCRDETAYRTTWKVKDGEKQVAIRVNLKSVTCELTHTLRLPRYLNNDRRWTNRLLKHEFDHVAISCDPRVALLVQQLYGDVKRVLTTVDADVKVDDKMVRPLIDKQYSARANAVIALIKSNYVLLDKVSRHGTAPIENRKVFFQSLFSKPNLDAAGFPYTGDVLELLKSKEYREAELLYDFGAK
jgi:hypothetical protein